MRSFSLLSLLFIALCCGLAADAQLASSAQASGATLRGVVREPGGMPANGAVIRIESKDGSIVEQASSDETGGFSLGGLAPGAYRVTARLEQRSSPSIDVSIPPSGDQPEVVLVIGSAQPGAAAKASPPSDGMEFSDTPTFTIAAVTDWTAAGGHGSDTILRTSEALARETLSLKPQQKPVGPTSTAARTQEEIELRAAVAKAPADFTANHELGELYREEGKYQQAIPFLRAAYRANPADELNAYDLARALEANGATSQALQLVEASLHQHRTGDLLRLQGTIQEKLGHPLEAAQAFEQAVHEDPSEENYFAWGSELLLHRAIWQARDVLSAGVKRHPASARLSTALGASLFACALYDEAAVQLCRAAELDPESSEPFEFLGKADIASPDPLPCAAPKLASFAMRHPDNPRANYDYAMALWKQHGRSSDPQVIEQLEPLLQRAVALDPGFSEAYLQLGNLYTSRRDLPAAIHLYLQALAADPQLGEAHYRLGIAYDRAGDHEKARREFQLHEQIEQAKKAEVERQRREIKQFLIVDSKPAEPASH